ncbi:MAG: hypothetical protein GX226_04425 [Dehalococcoidales bacterium]|nr:hypothetical protein [Dehalococcoidales bacterium]
MYEKELIDMLEKIEQPDIKTPVHKNHLEKNLLKTKMDNKNTGVFNVMNSAVEDIVNNTRYMFTSKQPAFRISIVAVLLTVTLALGIPAATTPAEELTEEQVIGILQADIDFMNLFIDEFEEIKVRNIGKSIAHIVVRGESTFATMQVDRRSKKITDSQITRSVNFTNEEKANILQILEDNQETRVLLETSASVKYSYITYNLSPAKHSALPQATTAYTGILLAFNESSIFYINDVGIKKDYLNICIDLIHEDIVVFYLENLNIYEIVRLTEILKADNRIASLIQEGMVIYDVDLSEKVEINISVQADLPEFQIGEDNLEPLTTETASTKTATVEKLITLYVNAGDSYYKIEVDFVNDTILSFDKIAGP